MNFNIGVEDVGIAVLQELWVRVTLQAKELASETRDVMIEKNSFQEFSRSISQLNILLHALDAKKIEAALGVEFTKTALETLSSQLQRGSRIIRDCKSGSRLRVLLHSSSVLGKMQALSNEIANTISSLDLMTLSISLNVKNMTRKVVEDLSTMEFRSSVATEMIATEIENSITDSRNNRERAVKLLENIAEAVGANANTAMVQREVEILKQEKEEMEVQKKRAEALQLSQLIQLLYSTEIIARPSDENLNPSPRHYPIDSFTCPLSGEMMEDPVAILCGHSFERKAIQEHFEKGGRTCPTCEEELQSTDVTPNHCLRGSIEEWKRRDMDLRFQSAVRGINSDDHSTQKRALEEMQSLVEMPSYAAKAAEENLIPKLVCFLEDRTAPADVSTILRCLTDLARQNEDIKEAIVEAGSLRSITKRLYKGGSEVDAIAILLELSSNETVAEKIGNTKNCIPLLVSMLNHGSVDASRKASEVLQNLSYNTHFVVKMAESGYLQPFVSRFNQAPQETRTLMAAALVQMQLKENSDNELKNEQFMHNLIQMLSANSPASKSACLKATKKLMAYPELVNLLLADPVTIPLLLGLIFYDRSAPHLQEAVEILALLVGSSENHHFQIFQGLKELQSEHNVGLFLQHVSNCDPQSKVRFLQLLVELARKSEAARDLLRSNDDAIMHLFSYLTSDQGKVRVWAMKLIHCISEGHPDGVPFPTSLGKDAVVNTLAGILTSYSPDIEERSVAAGIISELPKDDMTIDDILSRSDALKALRQVICGAGMEIHHIPTTSYQSKPLLENVLAVLLRYTDPNKPDLQKQVGRLELYPSLIRVLSTGSSLAKQRTAIALAHLSQSASMSFSSGTVSPLQKSNSLPLLPLAKVFTKLSSWCSASPEIENSCSVHGAACSPRETFCLIKADAVKPLLLSLSDTEGGVQEAALMALETMLADPRTISRATAAIMDNDGIVAILRVLEKGSLAAKLKALDLLEKMLSPAYISDPSFRRVEQVLVQILHDEALRKKAALVLRKMKLVPDQSSYF